MGAVCRNCAPWEVSLRDIYLWLDGEIRGVPLFPPAPEGLRVSLGGHVVGDGCPRFIVAEIGQNHNGQMGIAKRLIEMAANCGVSAVKFQRRDIRWELTDDAYRQPYRGANLFGAAYGEHREFLELGEAQHRELKDFAEAHRLVYF